MAFPSSLTTRAHILAAAGATPAAVLDRIQIVLSDNDAEITHEGEGFVEFKVPIGARLARDFGHFLRRPPWWPLAPIRGGTITLTEDLGVYRLTADVQTSAYPIVQLLPVALGAWFAPVHGIVARVIVGIACGFVLSSGIYLLAMWQFGSWLVRTAAEISDEAARGRLTSA
jgi:hypothetical protein